MEGYVELTRLALHTLFGCDFIILAKTESMIFNVGCLIVHRQNITCCGLS